MRDRGEMPKCQQYLSLCSNINVQLLFTLPFDNFPIFFGPIYLHEKKKRIITWEGPGILELKHSL